jgi:kynurenine formamidase
MRTRQIIDLSGPLHPGMWSYNVLPGLGARLPEFTLEPAATREAQGFEAFSLSLSSVTGTYFETAGHMLPNMPDLSDLDPSHFVRPAVVCHAPRQPPEGLIRRADLEAHCPPVQQGDALLIDCGWGAQWQSPSYVTQGPGFHVECLDWLLGLPFSILGVDVPCIETARSRPDGSAEAGNMLLPLFRRGMLLLGPLVNLDRIRSPRGTLIALPLAVAQVSGAPCRAIFIDNDLTTDDNI